MNKSDAEAADWPEIIVNADDYGMHQDINRGVRYCVEQGLVNRVSVAVCGEAAGREELGLLFRLQEQVPALGVGVHLMLTEGRPLTPCASCTDKAGRFLIHARRLAPRALFGMLNPLEVEKEWRAQIERVLEAGLQPSHLDTHQHVHLFPGLGRIYRDLAKRYGIRRLRCGYESLGRSLLHRRLDMAATQLLALPRYIAGVPRIRTLGMLQSCAFRFSCIQPRVARAISKRKPIEIMVHPGFETPALTDRFGYWNAHWSREIEELLRLQRYLSEKGFSILRHHRNPPQPATQNRSGLYGPPPDNALR